MRIQLISPALVLLLCASAHVSSARSESKSGSTKQDAVAPQQKVPPAGAAAGLTDLAGQEIFRRVSPSVALVLAGAGDGKPSSLSSGVILGADGVVFTAYHAVKNAKQLQVRLANGETFDQVELVGFDERRDVAALRIPAMHLPALAVANSSEAKPGDPLYVIANPRGLNSSVSNGVLSAVRLADEVPGAGSGYRLLQLTAPISPGSSGGVVVDAQARALGIVVSTLEGGQNLNFAVPLDSVAGISTQGGRTQFGSGTALRGPAARQERSQESAAGEVPAGGMAEIARAAKTIYLHSKNELIPSAPIEKKLLDSPDFQAWGLVILNAPKGADLVIELDRPALTWDFTFQITDVKTKAVLGSGKVIAWDGVRAAPSLAAEIVKRIKVLRPVPSQPGVGQKP